ncbi:MAG: hypothetical protein JO272_02390 [Pseudonocardiales bacterium]|nr:hypothetical protein [Pseudonocardiales bacterium]
MTGQAHATERERLRREPHAARGGHSAIGSQLAAVRVVITYGSQTLASLVTVDEHDRD